MANENYEAQWRKFKNTEPALEDPSLFADPINYIQPAAGLTRNAAIGIGQNVIKPMVTNLGLGLDQGAAGVVAPTLASKAANLMPGEIKDVASALRFIIGKLGGGGGGVVKKSLETGGGKPITTALVTDTTGDVTEAARNLVMSPSGAAGNAPVTPSPISGASPESAQVVPVAANSAPTEPAAAKPVSPYEAIKKLSDKDFKAFINANRNVPGLGYVEDPKTGKMTRIIEDPALKKPSAMTNAQLEVASKMLHGAGSMAYGIGQQHNAAVNRDAMRDIKEQAAFDARLKVRSPIMTTVDEMGNKTQSHDINAGLMSMIAAGEKIADPRYVDTVPQLANDLKRIELDFDQRYAEMFKKNPKLRPLSKWTLQEKLDNYYKSKSAATQQ